MVNVWEFVQIQTSMITQHKIRSLHKAQRPKGGYEKSRHIATNFLANCIISVTGVHLKCINFVYGRCSLNLTAILQENNLKTII